MKKRLGMTLCIPFIIAIAIGFSTLQLMGHLREDAARKKHLTKQDLDRISLELWKDAPERNSSRVASQNTAIPSTDVDAPSDSQEAAKPTAKQQKEGIPSSLPACLERATTDEERAGLLAPPPGGRRVSATTVATLPVFHLVEIVRGYVGIADFAEATAALDRRDWISARGYFSILLEKIADPLIKRRFCAYLAWWRTTLNWRRNI